jgi:hypothetical protein
MFTAESLNRASYNLEHMVHEWNNLPVINILLLYEIICITNIFWEFVKI